MEERFSLSPAEARGMNTDQLREAFALTRLWQPGSLQFTYTHYDRVAIGSAVPQDGPITLPTYTALKSAFFLERREMGIINIGGNGKITADGTSYELGKL